MIIYIFLLVTLVMFYLILVGVYLTLKSQKALQNLQQSAYDNKRYYRYIKGHYKVTFGVNELAPLIGMVIIFKYHLIFSGYIVATYFMYYNLRFLNIANSRYVSKIKLKVTKRVKRQISLYIFIELVLFIIFMKWGIIFSFVMLTYLVYPTIIIVNLILKPVEKRIKLHYQGQAEKKIALMSNLSVIGITGSFGKTSIKNIVGTVLDEFERTLITPESYNTPMGLTLTINDELNFYHQNFVAEMGAYYQGEINELCNLVHPTIGIVSSVGKQHLETFKTLETITKTKMELIEALPSNGLGILNMDNEYIMSYKIKNNVKIWYYSLNNPKADIYANNINYYLGYMTFDVVYGGKTYMVQTKLLGQHNVENILAAMLVLIYKSIAIEDIITVIKQLKPVTHRLEYKYINEELSILDDAFNSNPTGINEAINILHSYKDKKRIIITPGLIDLGEYTHEFHQNLGKIMQDKCDEVFIVGKLNRKDLLMNIDETSTYVHVEDDFITAYNKAIAISGEKVILIANDLPDKFNE